MGQFLYFIPAVAAADAQLLKKLQLADMLPAKCSQRSIAANGPGGTGGVLLQREGTAKYTSSQIWRKSAGGKYYVGYDPEDKPSEQSLSRAVQLAGHRVKLADGNSYLIPVARMITGGSALPQSMILGSKGEVIYEPLEKYAGYWHKAGELWQDIADQPEVPLLNDAARLQLAMEALGWNYYLGRQEINLLRLIDTQNIQGILEAVIDGPNIRQVAEAMQPADKKKDTPGGTDSSCSGSGG